MYFIESTVLQSTSKYRTFKIWNTVVQFLGFFLHFCFCFCFQEIGKKTELDNAKTSKNQNKCSVFEWHSKNGSFNMTLHHWKPDLSCTLIPSEYTLRSNNTFYVLFGFWLSLGAVKHEFFLTFLNCCYSPFKGSSRFSAAGILKPGNIGQRIVHYQLPPYNVNFFVGVKIRTCEEMISHLLSIPCYN